MLTRARWRSMRWAAYAERAAEQRRKCAGFCDEKKRHCLPRARLVDHGIVQTSSAESEDRSRSH